MWFGNATDTIPNPLRFKARVNLVVTSQDDLSEQWKDILIERLAMYRSLRDTTVAKFGETRVEEYDNAYSHFVGCFVANKIGGVHMVARKAV